MDLLAHAARLEPHLSVVRPTGLQRYPVVVQMHDCSGVNATQFRYAEAARDIGCAAVVLDSFAPLGISRPEAKATVCTGLRFRGDQRAVDLVATLKWLTRQPWADPDNIVVAGWSHGAWAAMEALAGSADEALEARALLSRLRAAILFYPYAGAASHTYRQGWGPHRPKVYACLAGRDMVVGRVAPARTFQRLRDDGLDVRILDLPDAGHCFDDPETNALFARYSPCLAEQARRFYLDALAEASAKPGPRLAFSR
ncbi:dienelactone hydrolase family protein [Phenylobacterium montanum]|uniref:Dienelactone hydrolase family protein n=1 Tax=Phenylobacterium montanum TaxID=2823693 RepID=A0A975FZB8_9CAUL|nr:dienelactone hydrolase family protein [Caulobacter sp. S6]QUD87936.1 dienelactone hydrolase family protein [Caulobacter sp. S6]